MSARMQFVVGVVVALVTATGAVAQSSRDQSARLAGLELTLASLVKEVQGLREQVSTLESRVAELESAVKGSAPSASESPTDADDESIDNELGEVIDGRVARIIASEARPIDERPLIEARHLREEADMLEADAAKKEKERNDLMLCNNNKNWPACGCKSREAHKTREFERRSLRQKLGEQLSKLRSNARSCNMQADRLENDARMPRQIIHGWDGEHMVILQTERDLSAHITEAVSGSGFITWIGTLVVSTPHGEQTWLVRRIKVIEEPSGFQDRP